MSECLDNCWQSTMCSFAHVQFDKDSILNWIVVPDGNSGEDKTNWTVLVVKTARLFRPKRSSSELIIAIKDERDRHFALNMGVGVPVFVGVWRVGIWVMSVHIIDLRSDVLWCFTTFYSVLSVYSYLCCVELLVIFIVEFEWPKRKPFMWCIYYE